MDNSCSLDLDIIIAEVKAQYKEMANCSQDETETRYHIKYEELQALAGKHGDNLLHRETEISEINLNICPIQAEIDGLKDQRASLGCITDEVQCGKPAVKDAPQAKVAEQEAALRIIKQDMVWHLHEYQELMNVQLALDMEVTTYHKLPEGEENRLESGMQNMSIHIKTTSGYSGGLSPAYWNLNNGVGFQASLDCGGDPGSFRHMSTSSFKKVVVKKIEVRDGKLVSESSGFLPR